MKPVKVQVQLLNSKAKLPSFGTPGSAGADVSSVEDIIISPGHIILASTGLAFNIPNGYEIQVRPRSGLSLQGLRVANAPGTVDSDYRGELKVALHNTTDDKYHVEEGDRIAQIVVKPVPRVKFIKVPNVSDDTERGKAGFGSTGK